MDDIQQQYFVLVKFSIICEKFIINYYNDESNKI